MQKILIAIDNDFTRETYSEIFKEEDFEVLKTKSGEETLALAKQIKPDMIIVDIELSKIGGFEVFEAIKKDPDIRDIPVIIFAQLEKKRDRIKAMEMEAKDFITAAQVAPAEVIRKVKIALGEQKSYRVTIMKNLYDARQLITDLGYDYDFKCPQCSSDLLLCLIRDLSKGEKYFILSIICSNCGK